MDKGDPLFKIHICGGKGGVGKTTSAVALALHLAHSGQPTTIIDHDGGLSVSHTLNIGAGGTSNTIQEVGRNLSLVVIEPFDYRDIVEIKAARMSLDKYLEQFPGHLGIIPWADMLFHFFGAPTDVEGIQKFAVLVRTLATLRQQGMTNVVIDVEPTTGLKRLLSGSKSMTRSLCNLGQTGWLMLQVLGAKWPEIAGYLKSDYLAKIKTYSQVVQESVDALTQAPFFLVCTPELGAIRQLDEVRSIVEGVGGKVHGYVVNAIRGLPYEERNLAPLLSKGLPVTRIPWRTELHYASVGHDKILLEIGAEIAELVAKSQ
ncbi:MAG: hypothetical protein EXS52_02080 [Candidatus Staskawiczbacteria bacterium]|nr:hypothetical protein [Candidatus Staskawiczbacteria bacterium]